MSINISHDQADEITLKSLEDSYRMTREFIDRFYTQEGWLHRDDIDEHVMVCFHLKAVIKYYGGSVD